MKQRLTILLGVGSVAILSVGLYWQSKVDHKFSFAIVEPRYQGESLSYWVQHLYSYNQTRLLNSTAQEAILTSGTDALPLLLDWISKPVPRISRPGQIEYQRHAVEAFEILGPIAKPAIPQLMKNVGKGSGYSMQALRFIGQDSVLPLADKLMETLADKHKPVMNWRDSGYMGGFFHVQEIIIHGLSDMGTNAEAAIPVMIKTMYANHGWGRREQGSDPYSALVSIGQNHPEVVVPALIGGLTNPAAPVLNRGAIAQAMSSFGTNHADVLLPVLIKTFNDNQTDDSNRGTIAGALAVIGRNQPHIVIPALVMIFSNKSSSVATRSSIASALAGFGGDARSVVPMLLAESRQPAKKSYDNYSRIQIAIAAKTIAPDSTNALDPLYQNLKSSELYIRQQTINALGGLGTNGQEAIPALLKCLAHPDWVTRDDAMHALNSLGAKSDECISALGDNLSHTNNFVVQAARESLTGLAAHSKLAFVTLIKKGICGQIGKDERWQARWALINISRDDPTYMLECLDAPDALV